MLKISSIKKAVSAAIAATAAVLTLAQSVLALDPVRYLGDANYSGWLDTGDVILVGNHLLGEDVIIYEIDGVSFPINPKIDINMDGEINVYDWVLLKRCVMELRHWDTDIEEEQPTEPDQPTEPVDPDYPIQKSEFISAPIKDIGASLPSQGEADLVIFYVDFPDCQYGQFDMTAEEVERIAFGDENKNNANYPFESMSAFYSRSSKGAMNLSGKVFRYTTKENQAAYNTDKVKIAEECYEAFKDSEDFSLYDGNGDGYIDATLFSVPTAAGDDDWWPCAGAFGDPYYMVDGVKIGHIITGNAQIESTTDYSNFTSSYLHEMGHCMGLPDYYLYGTDDFDAMHGAAGYEIMDADAFSDFGAFSKLMLGWYREDQVQIYDKSLGSMTYELSCAQTNDGNCVIIPIGDINDNYASGEYFVIEYAANVGNNDVTSIRWWQETSEGIRIYHVKPDIYDNGWWKFFKYSNGSEFTDSNGDGQPDDDGIRLIRLVNDGKDAFTSGSVISYGTPGFGWYDANELENTDPGVVISVGELKNGKYTITIE